MTKKSPGEQSCTQRISRFQRTLRKSSLPTSSRRNTDSQCAIQHIAGKNSPLEREDIDWSIYPQSETTGLGGSSREGHQRQRVRGTGPADATEQLRASTRRLATPPAAVPDISLPIKSPVLRLQNSLRPLRRCGRCRRRSPPLPLPAPPAEALCSAPGCKLCLGCHDCIVSESIAVQHRHSLQNNMRRE